LVSNESPCTTSY